MTEYEAMVQGSNTALRRIRHLLNGQDKPLEKDYDGLAEEFVVQFDVDLDHARVLLEVHQIVNDAIRPMRTIALGARFGRWFGEAVLGSLNKPMADPSQFTYRNPFNAFREAATKWNLPSEAPVGEKETEPGIGSGIEQPYVVPAGCDWSCPKEPHEWHPPKRRVKDNPQA